MCQLYARRPELARRERADYYAGSPAWHISTLPGFPGSSPPPCSCPRGECAINASSPPAVELRGITKRFPGVVANQRHRHHRPPRAPCTPSCGENGAGKSTLMKILYGMQQPDEGTITIDGEQVTFASPADAIARGIGMVHQHFMLADNLTVLENVVLGAREAVRHRRQGPQRRSGRSRTRTASGSAPTSSSRTSASPTASAWRSSRSSTAAPRTLILDEPTAVLVPQEVDALFDNLRELKAEGLTVIFISHKLGEVLSVADEITVIRRGTTVGTADPAYHHHQAARRADGRQRAALARDPRVDGHRRSRCSTVDGLRLAATDPDGVVREVLAGDLLHHPQGRGPRHRGRRGQRPGRAGRGASWACASPTAVSSRSTAPTSRTRPTRKRREDGIGYIPEDRHRHGLLLEAPLWENRILGHVTEQPNCRGAAARQQGAPARDTERIVREYDVRTPGIDVTAASLSGGNQQKLIVGREMSHSPKLLIAAHPTRGVDVGAQAQIWDQIREARREGLAVLLISADLDELIGLSDTLRVMYRGPSGRRRRPRHDHPRGAGLRHDRRRHRPPGAPENTGGEDR